MTLEVKADARFGLSSPSYLLGPVFEAEIGPFEPVVVIKKQMSCKKNKKRTDNCPIRPAGSAAGKNEARIGLAGRDYPEVPILETIGQI